VGIGDLESIVSARRFPDVRGSVYYIEIEGSAPLFFVFGRLDKPSRL